MSRYLEMLPEILDFKTTKIKDHGLNNEKFLIVN